MRGLLIIALSFFTLNAFSQADDLMRKADKEFEKGDYATAVHSYTDVIKADADNLNAYIQRGLALSIMEIYDSAVSDFDHVLKEKPELIHVRNSRGTAFMKLKKYDKAAQDFDAVIIADPENSDAYNNRGWCKKHLGDAEGACEDWKKSKKLGNSEAKIIMKNEGC